MGEFGKDEDSEGCPWRLEKCSAKLTQDSGDYYGSITGITGPSPVYAAGQPFSGSGWFLYRLNLDDENSVAYIEEMVPLRCAPELLIGPNLQPSFHAALISPSSQMDWWNESKWFSSE